MQTFRQSAGGISVCLFAIGAFFAVIGVSHLLALLITFGCFFWGIALLFLLLPVLRFCGSRKILPVCLILSIAVLLCILILPVNSMVADYNVGKYIDGSLKTVDNGYLTSLDYAAVPAAYRLREYWNTHQEPAKENNPAFLENWLTHHCRKIYTTDLFDWNIEKWRAKNTLDKMAETNAKG